MTDKVEKDKVEEEEEDNDENVFIDPKDVQRIETGDSIKVKQVLDESIVQTLTWLKYEPDYSWENIKLLLMFISCIFAVIAQFYPIPFPDSRPLLGVCCVGYFVLSGVLQFIELYMDEGLVMTVAPTEKSGNMKLRIESKFPRFQEWFTISIKILENASSTKQGDKNNLECTMYVGRYFTTDGDYDQVSFARDVEKILNRFTQEFISNSNSNSDSGSKDIQMKMDKFSIENSEKKKK